MACGTRSLLLMVRNNEGEKKDCEKSPCGTDLFLYIHEPKLNVGVFETSTFLKLFGRSAASLTSHL